MTLSRVEGITLVIFIWAFILYLLGQVVVYVRWRAQQRREQTAANALYGQGIRVLDGVYDQERDTDVIPTRIVSGPR